MSCFWNILLCNKQQHQHNNNKFASLHNYADQVVKVYDVFARTCYAQDDTTVKLDEIWHNTQVSTILLVHHHCLGTCEQQIFQNFWFLANLCNCHISLSGCVSGKKYLLINNKIDFNALVQWSVATVPVNVFVFLWPSFWKVVTADVDAVLQFKTVKHKLVMLLRWCSIPDFHL